MTLAEPDEKRILSFVKKEPRMIQDIAKHIQKTWVTADSYVQKIQKKTGLLATKVFRGGTQGAVKVVYYNSGESASADDLRKTLYDKIRLGRQKEDFDPLDIYQYIPSNKKKATLQRKQEDNNVYLQFHNFLKSAESEIQVFAGNNSWITMKEGKTPTSIIIEQLLKRGVTIRILCRIDLTALETLNTIIPLTKKYSALIEVRHAQQPLRGFIIDDKKVRLKDTKEASMYKPGEVKGTIKVVYEWTDEEWTQWLQQVFWNLWKEAPTLQQRKEELEKIF